MGGSEYYPPDDEHDDFRPVEPLLPIKVAAIQLGLTVKTVYDRAKRMASAEYSNRRFFKRNLLLHESGCPPAVGAGGHIVLSRNELLRR